MTIPLPTLSDSLAPISAALDAVRPDERLNWLRGLPRREFVAIFALAKGSRLTLDHFYGAEGEMVIHEGQNSLPAFSVFQKRFMKRGEVVQGYNHSSMAWLVGPGHFTVRQEGDEVVIDYLKHPTDVPPEFPPLARNDAGFSSLVYGGTEDWCRRVSQHVVIGEARKGVKPVGAYFFLVKPG